MEKLVILLITAGLGLTTERSSKQLFYSHHPYTGVNTISNKHASSPVVLYQPTAGGGSHHLVPYSNIYPFYSLWNNFATSVPWSPLSNTRTNDQTTSNQISQLPPQVNGAQHQEFQQSPQTFQGNERTSPNNAFSHPYFRIPLSPNYGGYHHQQYLWPQRNPSSSALPVDSNQINRNDITAWGAAELPLKSYEEIRQDAADSVVIKPYLSSEYSQGFNTPAIQNDQSFQRGQVESFPTNGESHSPQDSVFTRGHVESKPTGFSEVLASLRNAPAGNDYKVGFIRGAVEHSDFTGVEGYVAKQTRYDASAPKVICYFHSWSHYRSGKGKFSPENADPKLCTHIIYAFANLDKSKFAIKESDPRLDKDMHFYQRTVALKQRNPDLKVILGLGGWSDSGDDKYSALAHSAEARRKFTRDTVAYLKTYGFDGLSLAWHYPKCWQSDCAAGPATDKQSFSELLKELKSAFQPEGLILSISISGYKEVIDEAYDIPTVSRTTDFINVMTFDYHGPWDKKTGHIAPLFQGPLAFDPNPVYNANFTLEYLVSKGAERSKLILGAPMYGQSFQLSNPGDSGYGSESSGPGQAGQYTTQPGMLAYYEICANIKDKQWTPKMDLTRSWGPYAYKGNQWVGYDDIEFLTRKARYVKQQQFGGMFVWTMDLDDFQNLCCKGSLPLLRTIAKELLGIPYEPKNDCSPPVVPTTETPTPDKPPTTTTSTLETSTLETGKTCDNTWSFQADPADCSSYFQCVAGTVATKKCPSGLHWSSSSNSCDWPQYANCGSTTTIMTTSAPIITTTRPTTTTPTPQRPTVSSRPTTPQSPPVSGRCKAGEYSPGPTCDRYYLCNDGMQQIQSCGPGLHWNKDKKLCDWPQSANCQSSNQNKLHPQPVREKPVDSTGGCQTGEYTGSTEDCEVYYLCNHGMFLQFRCTGGLHWNSQAKLCDWPHNAGCTAYPGTPPPPAPPPRPPQLITTTAPPPTTTQEITNPPAPPQTSSTRPSTTYRPPPPQTSSTRPSTTYRPPPTPRPTTPSTLPNTPEPVYTSPQPGGKPPSTYSGDFMIVCYFTNWAWYRPGMGKYKPDSIDPNLCTHIVYGFAVLDFNDLVIKPHDTWADYDNHFYEQVTAFKSRGTKVTLAIGGWNDSAGDKYSRLVSSPAARRKFVSTVIEFLKKNNFDGLDLDWEYPKCWQVECSKGPPSDKPDFAALVKELKEAFVPHGLLLSAAVSPSKTVIDEAYDVSVIARYLDWIAVMTYDFHGQWDKKTGHVAPLYFHEEDDFFYFNANYSINYWMSQGADRKKIVMGMPLYGQSFTLANPNEHGLNAASTGGGTAGEFTRAAGFLSYYEICSRVQKDGWTVVKDPTGAMGPYAYKGNQWVSYDDVEMIQRKSQLIRDLNIGGGMVWALDLDDFKNSCGQGTYPLLTTIRNVLGRPAEGPSDESLPNLKFTTTTTTTPSTTTLMSYPLPVQTVTHAPVVTTSTRMPLPPPTSTSRPVQKQGDCSSEPFRPHESDCTKYYLCLFGNYIEQNCAPGTYWNKDRCDWVCGGTSSGVIETTPRPPQTTSTKRPSTTTQSWNPSTTQQQWTPPPTTTSSSWTPTTTKPTTSTSWEWKPPIITTTTINPIEVPPSEFKVVCYFTNWAWYRQGIGKYKPEDIDYNLCTHIAYGFAVLNGETLQIKTHDSWADIDNSFYKLVTDIKSKGKKVVIAIGGWNDSLGDKYSRLVRDAGARRRFIQNVIEFIKKYNFDGLDLDWEYPKCWQTDCKLGPSMDRENFAAFVRELKEAFTPYGYLLSSAVSPSKTIIDEAYDVPIINKYLDWIAVMTYDYHGQWDKKTGHVAPLYHHEESDNFYFNSNYTINYWMEKGADKKKLVMGMPMYGQSFTLSQASNHGLNAPSSGGGTAGDFTRASGFLAYYEICKNIKNGWTVVHDETGAIGPYAYRGDQWVSYDDIKMIRSKSEYIKQMGLGGGMIWALDLDDFRNVCGCEKHPLLKTINRVLRNYPEPDPHCKM